MINFLLVITAVLLPCETANILAVFPFTAHSHFTMFKALLEELHSRGHHLTVVSHFPRTQPSENYTDISLVGATKSLHANMSLSNLTHFGLIDNLRLLNEQVDDYEPIFTVPAVKKLISSHKSFDLILTEIFNTDIFLGFVHKFKCPNIAMSASPLMPWAYTRIGLPIQPSVMPIVFSSRTSPMPVLSMFANSIEWVVALFYYKLFMNPKSEVIVRRHFGDVPPLEDLAAQTSFILVNTHFSLHSYMPTNHKLIEVGGMHIKALQPLDLGLEKFLNESEHGVIVFSMGSMFRAESLPKELFDMFLTVFSTLNQNVLWKWESGKPPQVQNIRFMKWLPQRDVLAHPKVKLFIYHGGLLGTSEAVYCGVPILGLPQFGDMAHNLAALGEAGLTLSLATLTEPILRDAILKLINDPRHKRSAMRLSELYRDREESPLAKAVYWVEYTLRHNGTSHLATPPPDIHELIILTTVFLLCLFLPALTCLSVLSYIRPVDKRKQKMKEV